MMQTTNAHLRRGTMAVLWLIALLVMSPATGLAQMKKGPSRASKYSSLPSGYKRVGTSKLYYKKTSTAIDVLGYYNGYYYSSTYKDQGYRVAVQVGSNSAVKVNSLYGTTSGGVTVKASIIQQNDLARMVYTVTNNNSTDVVISLGTHADVMIGTNDHAPLSRRKDNAGQTYGMTMKDGKGAQLCALFGRGLAGVTPIDDYWFGYWTTNTDASYMVGNYKPNSGDQTTYYMKENGTYDSGMGWCWKNRTIPANGTATFSWLIGVGDVKLEPTSSFAVTPDDPDRWNDLSLPHLLVVAGNYESPAGLQGYIEYAVEGSNDWHVLTDTLASGEAFRDSLIAMFDPTKAVHTIDFRTQDLVNNTTVLPSITYLDVSFHPVSGIQSLTYTGDSLYQTQLTCDLDSGQYKYKFYKNNINVGTASFNIEGVFPYTIGRKTYTFTIAPQPLSGTIVFNQTTFVYNGSAFTPAWHFTNEKYQNLKKGQDYTVEWSNNRLPGTATLTVKGINNYTGSIVVTFVIDKAPLTSNLYNVKLPAEDITWDGKRHGATITSKATGVGEGTVYYQKQGTSTYTTSQPIDAGTYTVFVSFTDGTLYHGCSYTAVGSFTIYTLSDDEWAAIQNIYQELSGMAWKEPWNLSAGKACVSTLQGVTVEKGHVVGLALPAQNLTGPFPTSVLALTQLKVLDLTDNHLTGNVGVIAGRLPNLTALKVSGNGFTAVEPMLASTVTTVDLGRQTMDTVVTVNVVGNLADSIAQWVPSILRYEHAAQQYTTDFNLRFTNLPQTWSVQMENNGGTMRMPYLSSQNGYYGANGDTLTVAVMSSDTQREGSSYRIRLTFLPGDVNFDGAVNVLDVQTDALFLMERYKTKPFNFTAANLWTDNKVNVQDIIRLVNLLLADDNGQAKPAAAKGRPSMISKATEPVTNEATQATLYVDRGALMINTIVPVAAFDIIITGAETMHLTDQLLSQGMTLRTKRTADGLHIIGYSTTGACIPVGVSTIGSTEADAAAVQQAMLADMDAQAVSVALNSSATAISTVAMPQATDAGVYDLQGCKLNRAPRQGVYILDGRKVIK